MASSQITRVHNRLLASLPSDILAELLPKLQKVRLSPRETLLPAGAAIKYVYFPEEGMISLVAALDDGRRAEVGIIGREGVLGVPLVAGVDTIFTEANVQLPGMATRMSAGDFRREISYDGPFRAALLRYSEALAGQISQTAVCNGNHEIKERLARWLLMAHDRAKGDELSLTQDFMAMMLGVHRPSITISAGILQRAGVIGHFSSGRVKILDRDGLEAASCECYAAVVRRFASVMGAGF